MAAKTLGWPGLVPDDMRRSEFAIFAGLETTRKTVWEISGHRTNSAYKPYNIIDEDMQRRALRRAYEQQQKKIEEHKVIPLRQIG